MPLQPIQNYLATLHLEHMAVPEAAAGFSEPLQRQIVHVANAFIDLREEHFGPHSGQTTVSDRGHVIRGLVNFCLEEIGRGETEEAFIERTKLAEETLREIRSLHGHEHFFAQTLDHFYESFAFLAVDDPYFGHRLRWELEKYRKQRSVEQAEYLKPFHEYRDEMLRIVDGVRKHHPFVHFAVEDRIKLDYLAKLAERMETGKWAGSQDFYDQVGIRIVTGSRREVDAAVALIEGAFLVHRSLTMLDENVPHYFQIDNVEEHFSVPSLLDPAVHRNVVEGYAQRRHNVRGYRAKHLNVRRHCRHNGHHHPTAEIQVMSQGIRDWGAIQRLLIYKDDRIPPDVKTPVNAFLRSAADFIAGVEDGDEAGPLPDFTDIGILNHIVSDALRWDVFDRLADMDYLVRGYEKRRANGRS